MRRVILAAGASALLAVLAGCGHSTSPLSSAASSSTSGSTSAAAVATAQAQYDLVTQNMQGPDSVSAPPVGPVWFPLGIPRGCPLDPVTESFVCGPDTRHDGLTGTHSYQFLDAAGAPQSAYDSLTTAAIRFLSHLGGSQVRGGSSLSADDTLDLTESGMAGLETTRRWNGSGGSKRVETHADSTGATRTRTLQSITTVADVIVPSPFDRMSWPLSGTVSTYELDSNGTSRTSVITFNGTEFATMTLGDSTFTLDLGRGPCGGPVPGGGGHGGPGGPGGPGGRH